MSSRGLTVAGFPLRVQPVFFLIAAFLGGNQPLELLPVWVAVVFVSVLLHELGHAAVFRSFGVPCEIELHAMGGLTRSTGPADIGPLRLLAVSVAGPVTGVAAGLLALAVSRSVDTGGSQLLTAALSDLVFANLAWSVLNLLPILPLDGGQAMRSLLRLLVRGDTEPVAQAISLVALMALVTWALSTGRVYTALIFGMFWFQSITAYWRGRSFQRDAGRHEMVVVGSRLLTGGDPQGAARLAREVLASARSALVRTEAAQLLIWAGVVSKDGAAIEEGRRLRPPRAPVDPYLEGLADLVTGRHEEAVRHLTEAFASSPDDTRGAPLARALIAAGRPEDAISLLTGPQAPRVGPATREAVISGLRAAGLDGRADELAATPPPSRLSRSDVDVQMDVEEHQRPEDHGHERREERGEGAEVVEEVVGGGDDHADHEPHDAPARDAPSPPHTAP